MRLAHEKATVRVPATSANLGPGFDSFGLALRHYDEVSVRPIVGPSVVTVEGVGAGRVPTDDSNLVIRALRAGLEYAGAPQAGFEMRCLNRIPHSAGMGSSSAAVVAGLMLARGLISEPEALDDDAVLALATEFEGHPDNAAPAIFGGATLSWMHEGQPRSVAIALGEGHEVCLLVPPQGTRLSTKAARGVLPDAVPREDALFNLSRASLLVLALGGRRDLLMEATEDRLHQTYRRQVLSESMAVVDSLREQGYPAVISGAGPTVCVLSALPMQTGQALERHGWTVLRPGIDTDGAQVITQG